MNPGLFLLCCLAAASLGGGEATVRKIPVHIYHRGLDYYYQTGDPETARVNEAAAAAAAAAPARPSDNPPMPYQKYVACVPRTFLFHDCTLCYCTDVPNLGLCWYYEGDKCARTRQLVEAQKLQTQLGPARP